MNKLASNFHAVRALYKAISRCAGSFEHMSARTWRELANAAESLAKECREVADKMDAGQ